MRIVSLAESHEVMKRAIEKKLIADAIARAPRGSIIAIPELDRIVLIHEDGSAEEKCVKCLAYELRDELPVAPYTHQFTQPEVQMQWDVGKAWKLINASPRPPTPLDPTWARDWIENRSNLTPGHIDHLPSDPAVLLKPVLVDPWVWVSVLSPKPVFSQFTLLIDGHHRVARAIRDNSPLPPGYLLTDAEHSEVVTRTNGAYDPELVGWRTVEEARELHDIPIVEWKPWAT